MRFLVPLLFLTVFVKEASYPLFCLPSIDIMDELLLQLKHNAVGCHWDHHFAGAFCYADDLILLAPSLSALRIMLHTCKSFSVSHASKTQLIRFGSSPSCNCHATVFFCGSRLHFVILSLT